MKHSFKYILSAVLVLVLTSCNESDFLDETNPNELSSATFYQTDAQAQAAVNAVYANMQTLGLYIRRYFFVMDLLSGHAEGTVALEAGMRELETHSFLASNTAITDVWTSLYRGIHRANLVIKYVPGASDPTVPKDLYVAQARFLRAWHYYELVSQWGSVPLLKDVADATAIAGVPKSPEADIYALIIEDLNFAEQQLPESWSGADLGRATKGAAIALKGRVYLQMKNWQAANNEFTKLLGKYQLLPNYGDNFLEETENNAESIFEVQFANIGGSSNWSADGNGIYEVTYRAQEYSMFGWRNVVPRQRFLQEFEQGDPRYKATIYDPCDLYNNDEDVVYSPTKCPKPASDPTGQVTPDDRSNWRKYQNYYKQRDEQFASSGINFRVIRYADVLLGLAEAKAQLGDLAGAAQYVNMVRDRVDMPAVSFASKDAAINGILHERAVEFGGEQNFFKDLIRNWDTSFRTSWTGDLPGDDNKWKVLPIPQTEIDSNNALSGADQNPGY